MAITVGTLCYRKADLTPAQFKTYFEETHVPLLLKLCGPNASPTTYRRNYLQASESGGPMMLWGDAGKVDWDCFSEVTFESRELFERFGQAYAAHRQVINEDEARFLDHSRILVSVYETVIGNGGGN